MTEDEQDREPKPMSAGERLDSWKQIAAHLGRSVRTVHRWEKAEGLPVRRHMHRKLGTVYASRSEVDAWWQGRRARLEVEPEDSTAEAAAGSTRAPGRWRHALLPAAIGAIGLAGVVGSLRARPVERGAGPSDRVVLAVLPFEHLGGEPEQEYLTDGLTEQMIAELSRLHPERLGVIARTSMMQYKRTAKTARQVGRELGAAYLVEGSVRSEGDRVRITAQLIRTSDQTHLWAETYDRPLSDILTLQADAAREIAREIRLRLSRAQQARLTGRRQADPVAYRLYLQGRHHVNKRTTEGLTTGTQYLEQAIARDPNDALARADLSAVYTMLPYYGVRPPAECYPRAYEQVTRALEIDETLAEAHAVLATLLERWRWDWAGAERHFERSIALNPNYATAHHWYGLFLERRGRLEDARTEMARALELDPVSLIINKNMADPDFYAGNYDRAMAQYRKTLELDPGFSQARLFLGYVFEQKGHAAAAIAEYHRARERDDDPAVLAALAHALALNGEQHTARGILEELRRSSRYISPYHVAVVYVGLRQPDQAFAWLEKACTEPDDHVLHLTIDPRLRPLRPDPRYRRLIERVGLSLVVGAQAQPKQYTRPSWEPITSRPAATAGEAESAPPALNSHRRVPRARSIA